ncbi:MAG: hypothetical protein DMG88_15225 [Acidobacteria bacterium]|nr:MAG: hypothetical protein DMG88_15225 [Acidobacteriota bacterium]
MLLIEFILLVLAVFVAFVRPTVCSQYFERLERGFPRLAEKRRLSVAVVGFAALFLRIVLLPILHVPEPIVHDEFGYLLIANTFSHGRVTNPTHPMWVHFETFSVIQKPTYQCYTPAAQGLILAAGQTIMGHLFWGVWLSVGLMCSAICWMLQGWLPAGWALLGGFLSVLRFGVLGYWANSYWGGAAGAIGGALVMGALPRIIRFLHPRHAIAMGVGLTILANSRPYEGFVCSLPVGIALLMWLSCKSGPPLRDKLLRTIRPLCLVLTVGCAMTGYYFWRVTGSPFHTPYQIERNTYAFAPLMIWQPLPSQPVHRHPVIERMYQDEVGAYWFARSGFGFGFNLLRRCLAIWKFFLGPALTLPMLMLLAILPYGLSWKQVSPSTRLLLVIAGSVLAGLSLELSLFSPHYAAPLTCVILALVLKSMRRLRSWQWRGTPTGLFLARAVPTCIRRAASHSTSPVTCASLGPARP